MSVEQIHNMNYPQPEDRREAAPDMQLQAEANLFDSEDFAQGLLAAHAPAMVRLAIYAVNRQDLLPAGYSCLQKIYDEDAIRSKVNSWIKRERARLEEKT